MSANSPTPKVETNQSKVSEIAEFLFRYLKDKISLQNRDISLSFDDQPDGLFYVYNITKTNETIMIHETSSDGEFSSATPISLKSYSLTKTEGGWVFVDQKAMLNHTSSMDDLLVIYSRIRSAIELEEKRSVDGLVEEKKAETATLLEGSPFEK